MEVKETSVAPIPVSLKIVGKNGAILQTSEYVKEKIVLGRILSADLRIDDPRVSRIHALIEIRGEKVVITDLASSHGTFVNGKRVVEHTLHFGDVIRIGFVDIRVEKGSGTPSAGMSPSFDKRPVFEGEETLLEIDRSVLDQMDRRGAEPDRRKHDAFPEERRLEDRRKGERRVEQRAGGDRRKPTTPGTPPTLPPGVTEDRRTGEDRRKSLPYERRVGERRRGDRRIFDITSLERRIADRRTRRSEDELLPHELEQAFEAPEHHQELEVTILWGDHILDVSNYADPTIITVGESPKCDYIIPAVGIPDEFPLITIEEDGTAHLAVTPDMQGTVRARDQIYSVSELVAAKFARKFGEYYVVALKKDDFAKLSIGTINFFILYVKPAPRILPPPMIQRDPLIMRTFVGSLILFILLFVTTLLIPAPKPVTIEMIPERLAKIVIKKKPKLAIKGPETKQGGSVMGVGGPAKGPEGKAGEPNKPDKKEPPQAITPKKEKVGGRQDAQRSRKVVDRTKAKSVGLLKAFNMSGIKQELKGLVDSGKDGGGFDEFGKAVIGMRGKTLESGGGVGGRGFKGVDVGGGGKTVGIDGPSTKGGFGRGYEGNGIGEGIAGPGRLGYKGEHAISIVSENIQVLAGLPKDVINAVVQRHRAEIRACYDAALQRNPNLRGKITMAFSIEPSGIVSSAKIKENTLGDGGLGNCITARVKSWIFPKPEAPVVTEVTAFPFYLNPAN